MTSRQHTRPVPDREVDLAVVGGGMTGLAFAVAVADAGAEVAVIDPVPLPLSAAAPFDGRVTAIARASRHLLEGIGVWPAIDGSAEPIVDIEVSEHASPFRVFYDHREVGQEPLGHIVENRSIRSGLIEKARTLAGTTLTLALPDKVKRIERGAEAAGITLESGARLGARLIVGADGQNSLCRKDAGIDVMRFDYAQTGIVATIAHERPHEGVAVERFFPDGPLAILPMQGNRSSIVWAAENELAAALTDLDDETFLGELEERFDKRLGALALAGPRFHYPLSMAQAHRYTDVRLALIGDAARKIHPIAGQGWNLALRDVAALAELTIDTLRLGLDPGRSTVLKSYERWRRFDSLALIAITDGLNRLFANDVLPLKLAREWGLGLVNRTPPLKRFFMQHAMGLVGDLPRLMRGEPL
ncbi:MAG: UbiH/UbiF/VisC/COQ6 family ubiquinone biosynthesis hydroxylase [Alphaproteobacteria bacterium]